MKLSVIIVNYNVRAYLEQCLRAVFKSMEGIEGEVFVVDNQSTDGSVEMVRDRFPLVHLMANAENVGFSRANNQAIKASTGEHVLLLNPDTVVGEDVFRKVVDFLDANPSVGGLGVRMIDGTGQFLPESKRGLPTPAVAFYKIIGLTRLFPRSRVFGRYHLGHLPEHEAAPIEILSGACMFLRRKTLDEVGLLDESFFMYGEDIDLSYRITLGGYQNWYFPQARIIHYKGESTKKSSVNYVFVFYNAMAIFAQKHFTRRRTNLLSLLITGSIYLSAAGAIVMRFLRRALLPVLDLGLLYLLLAVLRLLEPSIRIMPGTIIGWSVALLLSFALLGAYDRPVRIINLFKGAAFFALLLFFWQDMPAQLRDTGWTAALPFIAQALPVAIAGLLTRLVLHLLRVKGYSLRTLDRKRVLAIGSPEENKQALALLWQTHFGLGRQKQMSAKEAASSDAIDLIRRKIRKHGIDEVVFCAKDLSWGRIIELIEGLRSTGAVFKIAGTGSELIIGPSSVESLQDLDIMEPHAVSSDAGRRAKRLVDIATSVLLLLTLPATIWLVEDKGGFVFNAWQVLLGRKSWVGYRAGGERSLKLPALRTGVIDPLSDQGPVADSVAVRANTDYAKDYSAWRDLFFMARSYRFLGHRR